MIVVLTYDAPHWKTERFLFELCSVDIHPDLVVGAPLRDLNLPPALRLHVKHDARHPAELCHRLGLDYICQPHDELEGGRLGIIAGARILKPEVIQRFRCGVLNLHPGLIPENRGLSNITRAVREGWPQAVTAHLIDGRVDAGRVLWSRIVRVEADDTPHDLAERLLDTQVGMLGLSVKAALSGGGEDVPEDAGGYERPIPREEEERIMAECWADYRLEQPRLLPRARRARDARGHARVG